jgi:hypothetical protein
MPLSYLQTVKEVLGFGGRRFGEMRLDFVAEEQHLSFLYNTRCNRTKNYVVRSDVPFGIIKPT